MNVPKHYSPVMPYIVLSNADDFIKFITEVFDAKEILRVPSDDGSVMHAEYSINGGTVMFGQAGGEWKAFQCGMFVVTENVDELHKRGLANGATEIQEPGDRGYGRASGFQDPFGNQWWLNTPSEA